jgi:repressor LexA
MNAFTSQVIYPKQKRVLDYVVQFIGKNGHAPTLRQIADGVGVTSLATVHEHLQTLEGKGFITRSRYNSRDIQINTPAADVFSEKVVSVPVLGYIAAGSPIEPMTDPNSTLSIPPDFIKSNKRTFVLQVRGTSMIDAQIGDGDFVICEETKEAKNGQIVVALLDNGMATLKRYFKEATRIRLEPANTTMNPIFVRNVTIQGRVVGLLRRYPEFY